MIPGARPRPRGFTLVEVLLVLAIAAVLLLVALPSYRGYLVRAARHDAQSMLMAFAQAMERRYQSDYSFLGAAEAGADTGPPSAALFWSRTPVEGEALYTLAIVEVAEDPPFYRLRATPVAGSRQAGNGFLELDSLGTRSWDRNDDGVVGTEERTWMRR